MPTTIITGEWEVLPELTMLPTILIKLMAKTDPKINISVDMAMKL